MARFLCIGLLLPAWLPGGAGSATQQQPDTAAVQQMLLGKWHWENKGSSDYGMRLEFFRDGKAVIAVRINKQWSQNPIKYKVLDRTKLEVTFDIGNDFTHNYITKTWDLAIEQDRLTLRMRPGSRLTFQR